MCFRCVLLTCTILLLLVVCLDVSWTATVDLSLEALEKRGINGIASTRKFFDGNGKELETTTTRNNLVTIYKWQMRGDMIHLLGE